MIKNKGKKFKPPTYSWVLNIALYLNYWIKEQEATVYIYK